MRLALVLALVLTTLPARADVPGPPPGPAPPAPPQQHCNVPATQQPGEQCVECSAWYEQADKCQRELGSQGYAQRCRSQGASVWREVWCRGSSGGPPPQRNGCGACAVGGEHDHDGAAWGLGLLALALLRRRP